MNVTTHRIFLDADGDIPWRYAASTTAHLSHVLSSWSLAVVTSLFFCGQRCRQCNLCTSPIDHHVRCRYKSFGNLLKDLFVQWRELSSITLSCGLFSLLSGACSGSFVLNSPVSSGNVFRHQPRRGLQMRQIVVVFLVRTCCLMLQMIF